MRLVVIYVIVLLCFTSCSFFRQETNQNIAARVGDNMLYKDQLKDITKSAVSKEDSLAKAQSYIEQWATRQLLMRGALRNLSQDEQTKFEDLLSSYKEDLYINAYKDALVRKRLDSVVTIEEASQFYEENKTNFILKEDLIQLRYIQVSEDFKDLDQLRDYFIDFDREDQYALDSLSLNFKNYFLNDSSWVKTNDVKSQINPITSGNAGNLLKKTNFLQLRDSLGLYLISVRKTLSRNDKAPLTYIKPTIDQIILNRRKLELVKQFEKDLKKDAIKEKKFEIYP